MDRTKLYETISNGCKAGSFSDGQELTVKLNPEEIWPSLFNIAENHPNSLSIFVTLLSQYCLFDGSFKENIPPLVSNEIKKLSDDQILLDQKISIIKKCLLLMPFIDAENSSIVFQSLISIIDAELKNSSKIVSFFLDLDKNFTLDADTPALEVFFSAFQKALGTPLSAAASIAYSPYACACLESNVDEQCIVAREALKLLNKDKYEKIAGCFMFQHIAALFVEEPGSAPKPLFKTLTQLMVSSDEDLQNIAHKTIRLMIDNGIFVSKQAVNTLLNQFDSYNEKTLPIFFKTIQRFLDDNENVALEVASAIFEFCKKKLASDNNYVASECIDLLTSIGHCNVKYIQPVQKQALEVIDKLLKADDVEGVASKCGGFLAVLKQGEQYEDALVSALASEKQTKKQKYELATAISTISNKEEAINKSLEVAMEGIKDMKKGEIYYIIEIIIELIPKINNTVANTVFDSLFTLLKEETDTKAANAIADALKKLVKTHDIQKEKLVEAVSFIMDGKLQVFNELPLSSFNDQETMLFHFVSVSISKCKEAGIGQSEKIISYLTDLSFGMLPSFLEVIETCIVNDIISKEEISKLIPLLLSLIETLMTSDEKEVLAVVKVIRTALCHCDYDKKAIYTSLNTLLTSDPEAVETAAFEPLFAFVLELSDSPLEDSFSEFISKSLPLPPPVENDAIYQQLLRLNSANQLQVPVLKCFVDVGLMKKSETDGLSISKETVEGCKAAVSAAIANDDATYKALIQTFGNSKAKQNRFNTVFKK